LNGAGAAMVRRSATPGPESTPQRPDRPPDEPTLFMIGMQTICCSYVPVYFCHIVTAADGCPCAVVISDAMIFFVGVKETRSVHFALCLFMCILHFVSACHKKKKRWPCCVSSVTDAVFQARQYLKIMHQHVRSGMKFSVLCLNVETKKATSRYEAFACSITFRGHA
jgi:hypothetical protein